MEYNLKNCTPTIYVEFYCDETLILKLQLKSVNIFLRTAQSNEFNEFIKGIKAYCKTKIKNEELALPASYQPIILKAKQYERFFTNCSVEYIKHNVTSVFENINVEMDGMLVIKLLINDYVFNLNES